jgi:hypothetical protein
MYTVIWLSCDLDGTNMDHLSCWLCSSLSIPIKIEDKYVHCHMTVTWLRWYQHGSFIILAVLKSIISNIRNTKKTRTTDITNMMSDLFITDLSHYFSGCIVETHITKFLHYIFNNHFHNFLFIIHENAKP